jgi:hypothetical protein
MPAGGKSQQAERMGALLSGEDAQLAEIAPDGGGEDALVQPDDYDSDLGEDGCETLQSGLTQKDVWDAIVKADYSVWDAAGDIYPGFHKYPLPKTRNDRGMTAEIMEALELWKRGNFGPRNFWKYWGAGIMEVNVECMQNAVPGHVWSAE